MEEIAPGLWRWTAPHPDWRPSARPDSAEDWDQLVGSALFEAPGGAVFFDPLLPLDREAFWAWSDARVGGRPVTVLTTLKWHRRNRAAFVDRYGAATSRARPNLPPGVESINIRGVGEMLFWLPGPATLIAGDRILGGHGGGLRLNPDSWMTYLRTPLTQTRLRRLLRPLLDLPVERVLVSHGEPVLSGGAAALRDLLHA